MASRGAPVVVRLVSAQMRPSWPNQKVRAGCSQHTPLRHVAVVEVEAEADLDPVANSFGSTVNHDGALANEPTEQGALLCGGQLSSPSLQATAGFFRQKIARLDAYSI